MLLARLGVGFLGLMDKDTIDVTNLNRVHGSRTADVDAGLAKVDILAREIRAAGLGTRSSPKRSGSAILICAICCAPATCFSAVPTTIRGG